MKQNFLLLSAIMLLQISIIKVAAQENSQVVSPPENGKATVVAGKHYKASGLKSFLFGKHYRKEWTTNVQVRVLNLDTLGGLTATEQGGGRQTKTLRLTSGQGKEYVLRSIDKDYGGALPDIAHGSFIERLAKDQVSTAHPYAAVTIPIMAEAAGIYHTNPIIVLVPPSPRLGKFNETFANTLCLFEERPDDNWSDAANFGNSANVIGTPRLHEKLREENDNRVDQHAYIRARLFDIFIGDWSRHDDQWRWAEIKQGGNTIYRPIPRDRDQTYTLFDGLLPFLGTTPENLEHLKSFGPKIKNIKKYNFSARYIDRQFTNELDEATWTAVAKDLQSRLTDEIIELSVKQMPGEVFAISGNKIISALKQRRNDLPAYAEKYYQWLNEHVEILGSKQNEFFHVERLDNDLTRVRIYDLNKEGQPKKQPFYSRTFKNHITEEIRLYGLDGNDIYQIDGKVRNGTKVRIIGGIGKDSITDNSTVPGVTNKTVIYDNPGNNIKTSSETKVRISSDTAINRFDYTGFRYNSGHTIKSPSYSNVKTVHFNLGYTYRKYDWRKEPFSWEQTLKGYYSLGNKSLGAEYEGIFTEAIGKWNLLVNGTYDEKLKHYFYGIGNETSNATLTDHSYYQLNTNEATGSIGLQRMFGRFHSFAFSGNYELGRVLRDEPTHFVDLTIPASASVFTKKHFLGGDASYHYHNVNDEIVPTKGFNFLAAAGHRRNIKLSSESFEKLSAGAAIYLPIGKALSLAIKGGATTIYGNPQFYQLGWVGGGQTIRGFRRERFRGRTVAFNQNELRWMFNSRSVLFNGKMGLLGFIDEGRVWNKNEISDKIHIGYGGGFFIVPFNKIVIGVNYGVSDEGGRLHFRFGKLL